MATAKQVSEWVKGSFRESDSAEVVGVSSIEAATPASVVFATDARTLGLALGSAAALILVNASLLDAAEIQDRRVIVVPDARYAFAEVACRLQARGETAGIHATAVIAGSAQIGKGTRIGAGSVIGEEATLGDNCDIGAKVVVYPKTVLGHRVIVQAGAVLGSTGFGYVRNAETGEYLLFPQQGILVIEDDVEIGANTTIDRGALGETRIGRGSKLDNLVHIGHNCVIGRDVIIAAQTGISGSSVIEDGAVLGGQVGIGEHALVGRGVILGGGAGVLSGKKMQGAGEVFWGRPARPLKEYLKDLARLRKR